nr:MAG TPA: hypothetical protein [Bacteriophage sp.]
MSTLNFLMLPLLMKFKKHFIVLLMMLLSGLTGERVKN